MSSVTSHEPVERINVQFRFARIDHETPAIKQVLVVQIGVLEGRDIGRLSDSNVVAASEETMLGRCLLVIDTLDMRDGSCGVRRSWRAPVRRNEFSLRWGVALPLTSINRSTACEFDRPRIDPMLMTGARRTDRTRPTSRRMS